MKKNKFLNLSTLGLAMVLGGCQSYLERTEGVTSFAGDSKAVNEVKMVEDHWPKHAYNNDIGGDGQRLGDTVQRYKQGQKEEEQNLEAVSTQ